MLTLLHISDLHFGPPFVPRAAEALLRAAHDHEPDLVVISGDFTQRAKEAQFQQARAFIDKLPQVPRVVTPGNHDIALYRIFERLFYPRALYRKHIEDRLNYVLDHDNVRIVSLDSTSPRRAISNGRIHRDQLLFVAQALRDVPEETVKIVVAHHHFAPAPDYERDQVMPKAKRAMDIFVKLKVDMVLGGHLHRAYIGNSLDVYRGHDPDHGIIIVQCGTSTSRRGRGREREKNSFNLVRLDRDMIRATHYMYFDPDDAFAPVSRHIFPRPGRRYVEHRADVPQEIGL